MRFKDVFSIIGPSMVGPSSSHTAGAVRIGRAARRIFGELPEQVDIKLYGSFAETYQGHGTDLALVGGLLDYDTDDLRLRDALKLAEDSAMKITFSTAFHTSIHPNTAELTLMKGNRKDVIAGSSIGGGNIEMLGVNGFDVKFTMNYPTLLIFHKDRPGMLADVTHILGDGDVNIGYMDVDRKGRSGDALTVVETDEPVALQLLERIRSLTDVTRVSSADLKAGEVSV